MAAKEQIQIQPPSGEQSVYQSDEYDEISLKDLILTLWGYRRTIVLLSLAAAILIVAIAGFAFLHQAKENVAKLQFKLDFQGVEKNEYPNGMKFSTSDILSMPVLNTVYKEDRLDQYVKFPVFKASLAVIQTNDQLRFLEYEYASKLDDKKLNVDQRAKLEAEFLEKKKSALVPIYALMWDLGAAENVASPPADQVKKVLNDILRAWAEYADRVKGANQYQISLASRNILSKEDLESQDYYIAMDMLRKTIKRITDNIKELEKIPGAKTLKIGKKGISLSDLAFRMADVENFKLSPLGGLIRQTGVTRDEKLAIGYLQNRLFELGLRSDEATANIKVYDDSLDRYLQKPVSVMARRDLETPLTPPAQPRAEGSVPAMIPQFGSSFLTSLIEMAQEHSDAQFRQDISNKMIDEGLRKANIDGELKYYEKLYKLIRDPGSQDTSKAFVDAARHRINSTMEAVFTILMQTIDEVNDMYLELSRVNLNPDSLLYNVPEPVMTSVERSLRPKKLLMYVVLSWILVEGMIIFGVLIANAFARPRQVSRKAI